MDIFTSSIPFRAAARVSSLLDLSGVLITAALAADPIKIGVLEDQSGDFAVAPSCKVRGIQLATIGRYGGPIHLARS
jgi:hypothetical protein